ncbi:hypothetical protein, partial [Escherichia coli]|uniref:hypothetical protein n=1 Tax=Escherichia coli TaxID=562 RepID=UPI001F4B87B2
MHQRQCGFVGEQDLQPAVGQDFFGRMAAYGVSDGIFTAVLSDIFCPDTVCRGYINAGYPVRKWIRLVPVWK